MHQHRLEIPGSTRCCSSHRITLIARGLHQHDLMGATHQEMPLRVVSVDQCNLI
jgi:hypothetical protein